MKREHALCGVAFRASLWLSWVPKPFAFKGPFLQKKQKQKQNNLLKLCFTTALVLKTNAIQAGFVIVDSLLLSASLPNRPMSRWPRVQKKKNYSQKAEDFPCHSLCLRLVPDSKLAS